MGRRGLQPRRPDPRGGDIQGREEQNSAQWGASVHSLEQVIWTALKQKYKNSKSLRRFLNLWVVIWNGFDGNIYITSARKLPRFKKPRILIHKKDEAEMNWYPTLMSEDFGDKIGGQILHLYWAEFSTGLGHPGRIFRKVEIELYMTTII